jgi:hypothetical protein
MNTFVAINNIINIIRYYWGILNGTGNTLEELNFQLNSSDSKNIPSFSVALQE